MCASNFSEKSGYSIQHRGIIPFGIHSNLSYTVEIRKAVKQGRPESR